MFFIVKSSVSCYVIVISFLFAAFVNGQLNIGDICGLRTGEDGICKLFRDCEPARIDLIKTRRFPEKCGLFGTQPIVCCDVNGTIPESTSLPQVSTTPPSQTSHYSEGSECVLRSSREKGECKLLSHCMSAREELQKYNRFPQNCGFQKKDLLVCCPRRIPGEISYKKCREYSKYAYDENQNGVCGHKIVRRIVGGEAVGRKEFPHMAAIGFEDSSNDIKWHCVGSIIREEYILTSGVCLNSIEFGPPKYVKLGVINLNDNSTHKQEIRIVECIPHTNYKMNSFYYDIGLIKLEKPIKMNSFCRPACLYTKKETTGQKVTATGWGSTSYVGTRSDDLLKVTLNLIDQEQCNETYKNSIGRKLRHGIIEETQVCAGSDGEEEKDACEGDGGGPLQVHHSNDDIECMYDIVGISSFGKGCGAPAGVYTRVSHFIKWIEDIVWT